MRRITKLIECVEIYNLCKHCDHLKGGECSVGAVDCAGEIEEQIVAEIRADAIDEFAGILKEDFVNAEDLNLSSDFFEYIDRNAEQLKEQKND